METLLKMKVTNRGRNDKIAFAAFVAAISVVVIHIGVSASCGSLNWWLYQMTAQGLCRWAVPFFFAVSGYFIAAHITEKDWWRRAVCKRSRTILLPYFLWNVIFFLFETGHLVIGNYAHNRPIMTNMLTGWDRLAWFGLHPINDPYKVTLWFLRVLFLLVLTSPFYVWLVRRLGWLSLGLLIILSYIEIPKLPCNFSFKCALYFTAGIAARMKPISLNRKYGLLLIGGLAWIAADKHLRMGLEGQLPLLAVCLMLVGLWALMPTVVLPECMVRSTFPIYLLHIFPLKIFVACFGYATTEWQVVVRLVLSVFFCMAMQELLRRTFPRMTMILFGSR